MDTKKDITLYIVIDKKKHHIGIIIFQNIYKDK